MIVYILEGCTLNGYHSIFGIYSNLTRANEEKEKWTKKDPDFYFGVSAHRVND